MNEWKVSYLYNGMDQHAFVMDDTIDGAMKRFRKIHPDVPGIAVYKVECIN